MKQRFKNLIIFCGVFFIFAPFFVFAQENTFTLKEKQALNLLDIIRQYPLSTAQFDLFFSSLEYPSSDSPAKTGAVTLVKQTILQSNLDYWLVKMPAEFSKRFIKAVYKILPAVTVGDFSGIISLIEKYTVEQANIYIQNWLKQNQVQIGSGIGKYAFVSFKNNPQVINIPYIIVYSPISATQAKIVVEFYSKTAIEPPIGTNPNALGSDRESPKTNCWPWDIWLESSYNKNSKTPNKIEPFIVRVKGQVVKDKYGNFSWDKTAVDTECQQPCVEVDFGKPVPEIDQSDIILANVEANQSQGFIKDTINQIKQKAQGIVDQVKNFFNIFKSSSPQAQISDFAESPNSPNNESKEEAVKPSPLPLELEKIAEQSQEIVDQAEQVVSEPENATTTYDDLLKIKAELEQAIKEKQAELDRLLALAFVATSSISSTDSTSSLQAICSQAVNQEPDFDKVIFNEIAWMGSIKSSSDEWIELKNISLKPIDLNGWQIFNKTQGLKIFFTTTTIVSPGGYYLLERTDDNTVPKIKADRIYTGALANTDEMLYLMAPNCVLQDKIKAIPYWIEGDNTTKETMERNQFYGWQTSSVVGGTPKAKNSIGKSKPSGGGGASANFQFSIFNFQNTTTTATSTSSAISTQQATTTEQATTTTQDATTTQNGTTSQQATTTQTATSSIEVLIVEIQTEDSSSTQNDFIKLFNQSTSSAVDISGWQLKKKSSTGHEYSIKVFSNGAVIGSQEYFAWLNSNYATSVSFGVVTSTQTISSNNSVALFNKNDEIVDQVAWGSSTNSFVEGTAFAENPSTGRNLIRIQDTGDNSVDFMLSELATSTENSASSSQATTTQAEELLPGITTLMAVPSTVRGSIDLFWTCPTSATAYIITKDGQTISQNIVPKPSGEVETFSVDDLPSDGKSYFTIKYIGLNGQNSLVSDNIVSVKAWPGFQDNGDTLTDLRTNLTWAKNANSPINSFGTSTTQDNAIDFITQQNSEWHLANFKELASLIEYKSTAPSVWSDFGNISLKKYWASNKRDAGSNGFGQPHTYNGWYADFSNGQINKDYFDGSQSQLYPFMAVKGSVIPGGMENDNFDFTNNNDGTVKDNRTGLMWLNSGFAVVYDSIHSGLGWQNAFYYANNAVLCNDGTLQGTYSVAGDCSNNGGVKYDDFRLPNVQETMEITKLGDSEILPWMSGYSSFYWTSTASGANNFWFVGESYNVGWISAGNKSNQFNVQLVRDP